MLCALRRPLPLHCSYHGILRRALTEFPSATQLIKDRDVIHSRCTLVRMDESTSEVHMLNIVKLSKMRLCKENGIQPRDLRVLDTDIQDQPASILARTGSILFCIPSIRAIIRSDHLLLLESVPAPDLLSDEHGAPGENVRTESIQSGNVHQPSEAIQCIAEDIHRLRMRERATAKVLGVKSDQQDAEREPEAPFEFLAIEALLSYALATLSETSAAVTERVSTLLHAMSTADVISTSQLQALVEVKDAAELFLRQAKEQKVALDDVLSEPADMKMMYLSDSRDGIAREIGDDDDLELLLEAYVKHASSLASTAQQNISRLQAASSHINLLLSSTRNRLLHLEIRVAMATLAFSAGGIIASIFGMNLLSGLEGNPVAFYCIVPLIGLVSFTYWRIGRSALSYARRLKMSQAGLLGGALREARMRPGISMRKERMEKMTHMRGKTTGERETSSGLF